MCIKGFRIVTMQLPEKFSPSDCGPTEVRIFGFLGSSLQRTLRRAAILPIFRAPLFAFEPVLVLLTIGHGGSFEGSGLVL
jgi:hypothetical protein